MALLLQPGRRFGALELLQTAPITSEALLKVQAEALTPHQVDFLSRTVWDHPDWKHQSEEG